MMTCAKDNDIGSCQNLYKSDLEKAASIRAAEDVKIMSGSCEINHSPETTGNTIAPVATPAVVSFPLHLPNVGRSQVFQIVRMPSDACRATTAVRAM